MSDSLRIAYMAGDFARPSDTFIRGEVNRLRTRGVDVRTFSLRRPSGEFGSDEDVVRHQANTDYILEHGVFRLVFAAVSMFFRRPKAWFGALRLAFATHVPGVRGFLLQLVYFVEASYLATRIRRLDIAHVHNHIAENSATVAMLAARLAGVPYSLTIHGPGVFFASERWALGKKLDLAAFTVCISDFCRSQCMLFAQPTTWPRLYVVRCAVDAAYLESPTRPKFEAGPSRILCVGRLCAAKGQRLLLDAAAALVAEGRDIHLQLVGDGPDRIALERRVRQLELSNVVEITGWKSSDEIRRLLQQATVFVLPSFAEGLPIVLMEAMAAECPVVTTRVAAHEELVKDGVNGWLISPGDSKFVTDALRDAITRPESELAALGRAGREAVLRMHDPTRQAEKLLGLFAGVPVSDCESQHADMATPSNGPEN